MTSKADPPNERPARVPWYADGVRFACQPDCGKCCTRHGEYDYVYLEGDDAARMAARLDLTPAQFKARWTKKDDGHTVLKMEGAACPFLEGTRCAVYDARPAQCGAFPFWADNLKTRAVWDELRTFCPGVGAGELIPLHVIRERLRGEASS